ncbi:MAG: filamentous hemagglutinin N-terminal domain-containing protein [Oscillatoria sp. PMC 1068.18]|nr:filamentous hemagglutinin N-terminal domain-containing protein [Oscillatoria sp. PMC 1076.18]MEC4989796.1 filamentous hemagglutinin N-terminal domain-containing protein [Oscillatoria sp. PMC 1068.18]
MKKAEVNKCYRFSIINLTAIRCALYTICVSTAIALWTNSASAQLLPDSTLSDENSRITTNTNINNQLIDLIEGGAIRHETLFHSFSEFNINEGQQVYFANPAQIQNILTRVTGKNRSNIFGTLGVIGEANLFLINPNGIIFGPNASLDIQGSFVASTANSFVWDNNLEYSATNPQAPPLLTVNLTPGLQYGIRQPATIINSGSLEVGKNLALLGGSVSSSGFLATPQGNLTIASVAGETQVNLTPELGLASISPLSLQQNVSRGDVSVKNAIAQTATLRAENNLILTEAQLATAGNLSLLAGENVEIRDTVNHPFIASAGENLIIQGNTGIDIFALNHPESGLFSGGEMILRSTNTVRGDAHYFSGGGFRIEKIDGSLGNLSSPFDPVIRSLGDVSFDSYNGASLHIFAAGKVEIPGFIQITGADPLQGIVETITLSDGTTLAINGQIEPTLDIRAGMNPAAIGVPEISNLGGIFFAPFLIPSSPNVTNTPTSAEINLGTIAFTDNNFNTLPGRAFITNQDRANPTLTGDIQINATIGNLVPELADFALITGGDVTIDSRGGVTLNGVVTSSGISGDAGNFTILANENISAIDTITASVSGNGGQILFLSRNSSIDTTNGNLISAANNGNGGKIELRARDNINTGNIVSSSGNLAELATTFDFDFLPDNLDNGTETGNGGEILIISDNGRIDTTNINLISLAANQNGGKITLNAGENINLGNLISGSGNLEEFIKILNTGIIPIGLTNNSEDGQGGKIEIISRNGAIVTTTGSIFSGSTNGDGGNISLTASGNITTGNVFSGSNNGNGGQIEINSENGVIETSANIVSTSTIANGGEIILTTTGDIFASNLISGGNEGNGGQIELISKNGEVNLTNLFIASSLVGEAGQVTINSEGNLNADTAIINTFGKTAGGAIELRSNNGVVNINSSIINSGGSAINISQFPILAEIDLQILQLSSELRDGGAIEIFGSEGINLETVFINASGGRGSETGRSGLTTFESNGTIFFNNTILDNETFLGTGNEINFNAEKVILSRSTIASDAQTNIDSDGRSSDINIKAREVQLSEGSGIIVQNRSNNPSGNLTINTERLEIFDASIVSTTTDTDFSGGRGGNLTINARDFILLDGSSTDFELGINLLSIDLPVEERELLTAAIASSTLGEADGGTIVINTPELTIVNGAGIIAASASRGDGGSIIINANQIQLSGTSANQVIPSGISVDTIFPDFSGATAGNIIIQTNQLTLTNGAVISASTTSDSQGGDIEIQANLIQLQGTSTDGEIRSGIRAQSFAGGNAGSIRIKAENVTVVDEGIIAVSSDTESEEVVDLLTRSQQILSFVQLFVPGSFSDLDIEISAGSGDAGIVEIEAENIFLNKRGTIIAITSSGEGGNISLDIDDLVEIRRNSSLSATAGGTGNGGNIDINAKFVIAVPAENSDLTANAFAGNGGNININATEIFGLEFRPGISDRSDITVSSELGIDGTVNLNTPDIDPSRGLTEFSEELPNAEIAQNCQTIGGQTSTSSFIPVGRGGQPASPDRPLNNNSIDVPWTNPNFESSSSSSNQIVEAKGWVRLANGDVVFTNNSSNLSLPGCVIQGSQR